MEKSPENIETVKKYSYELYRGLGGEIREKDYQNMLKRAEDAVKSDNKSSVLQAEMIADASGITLENSDGRSDPRIILYGILRSDTGQNEHYNYSRMSDQQLFAEALRMLGDEDLLKKLVKAHPNIFPEKNK